MSIQPEQQVLPHLQPRNWDRRGNPEQLVHRNSARRPSNARDDSHGDEVTEGVYTNDAMDYTAVLGPLMLGSFRGASRDDVEKLP